MTATPGASPAMTPAGKPGGEAKPAGPTPAPATQN